MKADKSQPAAAVGGKTDVACGTDREYIIRLCNIPSNSNHLREFVSHPQSHQKYFLLGYFTTVCN